MSATMRTSPGHPAMAGITPADPIRRLPVELRQKIYFYLGVPVGGLWLHPCDGETLEITDWTLGTGSHLTPRISFSSGDATYTEFCSSRTDIALMRTSKFYLSEYLTLYLGSNRGFLEISDTSSRFRSRIMAKQDRPYLPVSASIKYALGDDEWNDLSGLDHVRNLVISSDGPTIFTIGMTIDEEILLKRLGRRHGCKSLESQQGLIRKHIDATPAFNDFVRHNGIRRMVGAMFQLHKAFSSLRRLHVDMILVSAYDDIFKPASRYLAILIGVDMVATGFAAVIVNNQHVQEIGIGLRTSHRVCRGEIFRQTAFGTSKFTLNIHGAAQERRCELALRWTKFVILREILPLIRKELQAKQISFGQMSCSERHFFLLSILQYDRVRTAMQLCIPAADELALETRRDGLAPDFPWECQITKQRLEPGDERKPMPPLRSFFNAEAKLFQEISCNWREELNLRWYPPAGGAPHPEGSSQPEP